MNDGAKNRKRLHPAKSRDIIKALTTLGFAVRHSKGSHVFLKRDSDKRTTTIPVHPGEEIDRGLIRKIAADAGIEPEELMYLIDQM
ncbi:MAG: type II toxin-antitoxin system HicA family toxin [Thaumarchaeota archaeon]|nr:type II toxin-antitoxin system HicA family toxin [Nitrososphaerota archaeon]